MNRTLIALLLSLLTASLSKGQTNDSIAYVYFHFSNDTIITVITNSFYYNEDTYYSIEKITTSSKDRKRIKAAYCSKNNINRKLDSISNLGYLKGINISNKCKSDYILKKNKKRLWEKQEKVNYSVTDRRILDGETLFHHKSRTREYLFNSEYPRELQISHIFRPESFIWLSPNNNIRYCLFTSLYAEYDGNRKMTILSRSSAEIITSH